VIEALSSQCFYHCVDTSVGGLLVRGGIIHPVVSASITVDTSVGGLLVRSGIIHPVVTVIEALTTGWMIPPWTNSPPTEVSTQ
jgi:hypothetical protein